MTESRHTIVMTGATSGLGAHAFAHLAGSPGTDIIVGARGSRDLPNATVLPLDLASLQSVRDFAEAVKQQLGDRKIDMLVLNAGSLTLVRMKIRSSSQLFEFSGCESFAFGVVVEGRLDVVECSV